MSKNAFADNLAIDVMSDFLHEAGTGNSNTGNLEIGNPEIGKKGTPKASLTFELKVASNGAHYSDSAPELQVISRPSSLEIPDLESFHAFSESFFKRSIDLIGAIGLLMLTWPLMVMAWVAVRLTSKGPAILCQDRLTLGAKPFKMYKFRSMYVGAEHASGAVWAKKDDPRITPFGRFIRKTRIDELPQLVNVLKGEMSLVGPRPERPELIESLRAVLPNFDSRLAVKAGLTGLAQVSNGYSASFGSYRRKLAFDRVYIQKQGALLDISILLKTVGTVIFGGKGAR